AQNNACRGRRGIPARFRSSSSGSDDCARQHDRNRLYGCRCE
ncbi:MAG: hypothetical protein AVDCRST_MAG93-2295, partial [uncultured Chloroflexia bacterium]